MVNNACNRASIDDGKHSHYQFLNGVWHKGGLALSSSAQALAFLLAVNLEMRSDFLPRVEQASSVTHRKVSPSITELQTLLPIALY